MVSRGEGLVFMELFQLRLQVKAQVCQEIESCLFVSRAQKSAASERLVRSAAASLSTARSKPPAAVNSQRERTRKLEPRLASRAREAARATCWKSP